MTTGQKKDLTSKIKITAFVMIIFALLISGLAGQTRSYAEDGPFYYVTINVTDQEGGAIEDPEILFERLHTSYSSSMTKKIEPEGGKYKVDCGEGFAVCYIEVSAAGFDKKTLNLDPREAAPQGSNEVSITVALTRAKDPDRERNLSFRVVDSAGADIQGAELVLERNKRGYVYDQVEPVSGMDYKVRETYDSGEYYWQYRFRASADGYQSVTGEEFSFKSAYYNQYFDPATDADPIVVSVRLKSDEEVLNEAKDAAIQALKSYKDRTKYREAEQQEYDRIISERSSEIRNAASKAGVDSFLSAGKRELDSLKTAEEYEYEELRKNIFFRASNGRVVELDDSGLITLTDADSGTFFFRKEGGGTYTNNASATYWRCEVKITAGTSTSYNYVIGAYGQYQPRVIGGPYDATVKIRDLGKTIPFRVKVVKEEIDELKAYVDGSDVSGGEIHVLGSEEKRATIKAHIKDTDKWKTLPINAVEFTPGGSVSVDHSNGVFRAWGKTGSMTYSLTTDPSIKVSFSIISDPVPVTGLDVYVPSMNYIDYWDSLSGQYTGILEGDPDEKDRYHVKVYPDNATNPSVIWEALTPDIATQTDRHSDGIVPKKAGDAEFIVRSVDNPSVFKKVTVKFRYRKPLYRASAEREVIYMKKGSTRDINIITNGKSNSRDGATEQRFRWTFSENRIVTITDKVITDASLSGAKEFKHTIKALKEGVITVTGYPYDDSEGCAPVVFTIVVSNDIDKDRAAVKRVEDLINSIGTVTLEKEELIKNARAAFNALTKLQKGMVDDKVYAKLVAAELMLRNLKRESRVPDKETSPEDDNGGKRDPSNSSGKKKGSGEERKEESPGSDKGGGNGDSPLRPGQQGGDPADGPGAGDAGGPAASGMTGAESVAEPVEDDSNSAGDAADEASKAADDASMIASGPEAAPELIEAREIDIDEFKEEIKEQSEADNDPALLTVLLLAMLAAFFGGQKKYREYKTETR